MAAVAAVVAVVYMRIFLEDTSRQVDPLQHPILKPAVSETTQVGNESSNNTDPIKKIPLPKEIIRLLKSR